MNSQQAAMIFYDACMAEITALKPGNVHIFADGHGMVVQDFIKSAEVASVAISQHNLSVGQRIQKAMDATWKAVGCNTNLGILLLAAPLIHTALNIGQPVTASLLQNTLHGLTVDDAASTFAAIQQASPAGLGESDEHDVHQPADVTLFTAMQSAKDRDLIAQQYADNYKDIFETGLPAYVDALARWENAAWATTALYLKILSAYPDSHIARKYGAETAHRIMEEAAIHNHAFSETKNPKDCQRTLLEFDASLKARNINPGTSADMTVAALILHHLQ